MTTTIKKTTLIQTLFIIITAMTLLSACNAEDKAQEAEIVATNKAIVAVNEAIFVTIDALKTPTKTTVPESVLTTAIAATNEAASATVAALFAPTETPPDMSATETALAIPIENAEPSTEFDQLDVQQIIQTSTANTESVQTLNTQTLITMDMDMDSSGAALFAISNECVSDIDNNQTHCQSETSTTMAEETESQTSEFVQIGAETWFWNEIKETWEPASEEYEPTTNIFTNINTLMQSAEITQKTIINGQEMYEISTQIDFETMTEILAEQNGFAEAILSFGDIESADIVTTIWVGKDDSLIHKQLIVMDFVFIGATISYAIQTVQSAFNEPVDMPDPTSN